jgi:hypothetical protein
VADAIRSRLHFDGLWCLEADGVRTAAPSDRVLSMGDRSWKNYEATVRLTIHGFTPSAPGPPTYDVTHFGVAMRWRGYHTDGLQPRRKWYPLGAQGEFLLRQKTCRWRILFDNLTENHRRTQRARRACMLANP